jgi:beta-N-acetylhexosaminidase
LVDVLSIGGLLIMGRNVEGATPDGLRIVIDEFQSMSLATGHPPLLVAADQEGGRVCRFGPPYFSTYPTPRELGEKHDAVAVRSMFDRMGSDIRKVGVNWVLAPVMDIDSNPNNPVIGDRSFGADAETVSDLGVAAINGLQVGADLLACAKHFPGHGDTSVDSHFELPTVTHGLARLREFELMPFAAAVKAGVGSIMTGHILFPEIDPSFPATLSPTIISGILRKEMGYDGLVVADCLEMKSVAQRWGSSEAAILAVQAGVDMVISSHTFEVQHEIRDALLSAVLSGRISEDRIDDANRRIARAKARWISPALMPLASRHPVA